MRFHDDVVMFEFAGFPMIGNLETGYIIGLNEQGASLCKKILATGAEEKEISQVDSNLVPHLRSGHFFTNCDSEPHSASGAYLHVTQKCNLDCVGCYSYDTTRNFSPDPTTEELKRAINLLSALNVRSLVVSGGEPFTRNDLPEIIDHAYRVASIKDITIITNGTLCERTPLRKLRGIVSKIAVSIDAYSENTRSYIRNGQNFKQLVKAIRLIQSENIPAHLTPTIHKKNYTDINHYMCLAKDLGASINFSLLSHPESDPEIISLLPSNEDQKEIGKLSLQSNHSEIAFRDTPLALSLCARKCCGLGKNTYSVASNGNIYPCHMLHNERYRLGNAFTCDPKTVTQSKVRSELALVHVDNFTECNECSIKYLCGGGCRARAFYLSNTFDGKDSYCAMIKAFYSEYADMIKRAKERR